MASMLHFPAEDRLKQGALDALLYDERPYDALLYDAHLYDACILLIY